MFVIAYLLTPQKLLKDAEILSEVDSYSTVMNVVSDQTAKYNNLSSLTFCQLCKIMGCCSS